MLFIFLYKAFLFCMRVYKLHIHHFVKKGLIVMRDFVHQSVEFIRAQAKERGFQKCVVGLSGGVDSAVVVALATLALGSEYVSALLMPSLTSSQRHLDDAINLAYSLQIHTKIIHLSSFQEAFSRQEGFEMHTLDHMQRMRMGNFCARIRMMFLYDYAFADGALVLGTSNKSELLLGYGTIFGDLACAINPIGGLYKTQIFALAFELGVPDSIIGKKPSADLFPGQSDEVDLGYSYEQIDRLLSCFERLGGVQARDKHAREGIKLALKENGFTVEMIDFLTDRIWRNGFKREMPLVFEYGGSTYAMD